MFYLHHIIKMTIWYVVGAWGKDDLLLGMKIFVSLVLSFGIVQTLSDVLSPLCFNDDDDDDDEDFKYSNEINYVLEGCKWIWRTMGTWLQVDSSLNVFNLHDYQKIYSCDYLSDSVSMEYILERWRRRQAALDERTWCPKKRCLQQTIGRVRLDKDTIMDRPSLPVDTNKQPLNHESHRDKRLLTKRFIAFWRKR